LNGNDSEIAEEFKNQLKNVVGQAKSRLLIVFDEIENISPGTAASSHWETGRDSLLFWQNLRSFIQQEAQGRVAICLVGTSPLLLERPKIEGVANPMYLYSQKRFIPTFSFDETREMIERLGFFMGIEIEPTKIAKLHSAYGGHPFFIRQVCSNIHKNVGAVRPIKVSEKQLSAAMEEFGGQLESYLEDILRSLKEFYPQEFELLEAVAVGDMTEVSEYGREAPDLIDHLIGYGLIERRGDDFDIRFPSVKVALNRMLEKREPNKFWEECMVRRNRIEIEVRRELFYCSKNLPASEWIALLRGGLTRRRYENLASTEPRVLFSRTTSPLYWTDLISILNLDCVLEYLGERKSAILKAMHTVNSLGRKDSHANELTDEEFSLVSEALSVLEDEFKQPD
jgi:hypothetical protein